VAIPIAACLPLLFRAAGSEFSEGTLGAFGWPLVAFALGVVLVLACEMSRFGQAGSRIVDAALGIFALSYIGVLISFWALLRLAPGHRLGIAALFSMLLIVKMADTGAYFCGRMFGRTKMTPLLSPGKTWEGAAGGVVTACIISWLFFRFVASAMVGSGYRAPALGAPLAYGALLAVAGMVGDLAESLLKREMDRKDSSTWLPGLGGVLDIIDAVLVAGPVAFVCWECGLLGP
jgi:phosphatidate cytidylyltransferase